MTKPNHLRGKPHDDSYIVTGFVVIDGLLMLMGYQDDRRMHISASEIMTVAIVATKSFHNHHERALNMMQRLGYIPKLSISRFNRRLHNLLNLFYQAMELLGDLLACNIVYIIGTMSMSVCKRVRVSRRQKAQGR